MKRTVIIGSNTKTTSYAFLAATRLKNNGHEFFPVGISEGKVLGKKILNIHDMPVIEDVDTVTLYINPTRQVEWYDYILSLKPKRIIFNPGTENQELKNKAEAQGIICEEACTLVMLSVGNF
ncbi:CoA-binding protein [Roseivirga echinicomitans]